MLRTHIFNEVPPTLIFTVNSVPLELWDVPQGYTAAHKQIAFDILSRKAASLMSLIIPNQNYNFVN